ncbi:hypothetical protein [Prochlorococcus sp. MIT 1303]|uniref:hypothetical protein n=1 Tax=Prochlorococcus sp. MIT 1303 TaxID=1723647 RepID=UPI0007B3AC83|nr:hypothetical protein [Prochlorococcus sp. MIT 1303]KZR64421.1 hypothetical protein PMIT1303_01466 [Prochlorococcus sp. MIT 1303]
MVASNPIQNNLNLYGQQTAGDVSKAGSRLLGTSEWDEASGLTTGSVGSSDYVDSLESPTSTGVIGADGNEDPNDNDIQGDVFQDQLTL